MPKGIYKRLAPEARFWELVNKTDTCWLWAGALLENGYGRLMANGKVVKAHRFSYELLRGPIPRGLELDHLCRVRSCVNPDHLEPVTRQENARRAAVFIIACAKGHQYTAENTYLDPQGWRACLTCRRIASRDYQRRRRAHPMYSRLGDSPPSYTLQQERRDAEAEQVDRRGAASLGRFSQAD